jgi:hypothetical protein
MGIPGTEPLDYLRLLKKEGLSYSPDMVMVFFFIGNDIVLFLEKDMAPQKPAVYTFRLIGYGYKAIAKLDLWKIHTGDIDGGVVKDREHRFYKVIGNLGKYMTDENKSSLIWSSPELSEAYWASLEPIVGMHRLCRERGIELVVVLIPEDVQVDPVLADVVLRRYRSIDWEDVTNKYGFDLARKGRFVNFEIPNKALLSDFGRLGIDVIDLYDSFAGYYEANHDALYNSFDGHWNELGNQHAADSLSGPLLNNADISSFMGRTPDASSSGGTN